MTVGEVALVLMDTVLHYPNDFDGPLKEAVGDKIRQYLTHYNNRPSTAIFFMTDIASTSGRLHCEFVRLLLLLSSCRLIGKLTAFLQLQDFIYRKPTSTSAARRSPHSSSLRSATSSPRMQRYGLSWISDPSPLTLSLSSHRHSYIRILFASRFISS